MAFISICLFVLSVIQFSAAAFTWSDCAPDKATAWIAVNNISATPSPVQIPGNMTLAISGEVKHDIPEDVSLNVIMQKHLLGRWTNVPCLLDVGTCTYDHPCEFLKQFGKSGCPAALQNNGLPCTCPFKLDRLSLPSSVFEITHLTQAWRWLINGDYRMRVEFKHGGTVIGCFGVYIQFRVDSAGIIG